MRTLTITLVYEVPSSETDNKFDELLSDLEEICSRAPYGYELFDSTWETED